MNSWAMKRRTRKKSTPFKPTHDEINAAIEEFLKNGGKIKKIKPDDNNLQQFTVRKESSVVVDDFLFDRL